METMSTTKVLSIAELGHDEYWLRDMIYEDPSILGLGELQAVMKEKTQSQGGRLDLLLKDPEDNRCMKWNCNWAQLTNHI